MQQAHLEDYKETNSMHSLGNVYLFSRTEDFTYKQVRAIHGMGLKWSILNTKWERSLLASLYDRTGALPFSGIIPRPSHVRIDVKIEYAHTIFEERRNKTENLYNSLVSACGYSVST